VEERAARVQFEVELHHLELLAQSIKERPLVPLSREGMAERVLPLENGRSPSEATGGQVRGKDAMS
jgi:hypothetical protein